MSLIRRTSTLAALAGLGLQRGRVPCAEADWISQRNQTASHRLASERQWRHWRHGNECSSCSRMGACGPAPQHHAISHCHIMDVSLAYDANRRIADTVSGEALYARQMFALVWHGCCDLTGCSRDPLIPEASSYPEFTGIPLNSDLRILHALSTVVAKRVSQRATASRMTDTVSVSSLWCIRPCNIGHVIPPT